MEKSLVYLSILQVFPPGVLPGGRGLWPATIGSENIVLRLYPLMQVLHRLRTP